MKENQKTMNCFLGIRWGGGEGGGVKPESWEKRETKNKQTKILIGKTQVVSTDYKNSTMFTMTKTTIYVSKQLVL